MAASTEELLALAVGASQQLSQLEGTAKLLIDEMATRAPEATDRLKELLATGEQLVASVQHATTQLAAVLPGGQALPPGPSRSAVDAVWERQQAQQQEPQLLPTPVSQPAGTLAELVASLNQLPGCSLQLLQGRTPVVETAAASAALLRCGRALAAVVQLQQAGGLVPLRVGVLSAAEADAALAAAGGGASLWAPSQHAVFQQLSRLAADALRHFLQQQQQGTAGCALELLLLWLATHGDLFTRRSSSGGTLLLADPAGSGGGLLPPLRRPVQLGWQELWQAALNPHLRQAEHLAEA